MGEKKVSATIAWVVSATFLNCHRPPIDESQAEQASATPRQLPELREYREDDAGGIGISKDLRIAYSRYLLHRGCRG